MKRPLEEAAELFRQNGAGTSGPEEKANLYRGLALLADGLRKIEKELEVLATERDAANSHTARPVRRIRTFTVPPNL